MTNGCNRSRQASCGGLLSTRGPPRAAEDRGHVGESHADAESYEMSRFRFRIASAVVDPPERNDASWSYLWMWEG